MEEDTGLLQEGRLELEDLVCLRLGEWTRNEMAGALSPLEKELIKVARWEHDKSRTAHPWRCPFFLDEHSGGRCTVYEHRPLQCQLLFCGDTRPLEAHIAQGKSLDRSSVLHALPEDILPASTRSLWQELAATHEAQCPADECLRSAYALGFYPRSAQYAGERSEVSPEEGFGRLTHLARMDEAFRDLCRRRAHVPARVLPFLLGRPVTALLAEVGCLPRNALRVDG